MVKWNESLCVAEQRHDLRFSALAFTTQAQLSAEYQHGCFDSQRLNTASKLV